MSVSGRELQTLFSVGTLGGVSDGRLVERFAAHREEAAFEALVRRHGSMVWGICRRLLRDHHDAEDAFQATFLVLARKSQSIAQRELVANWLYGVAYQTALKARSTRAKRRMREGQVTEMPEPEAVSLNQPDDLTESLDRELSRLPDKYRIPIVLCELQQKSHREAAEQLGWPIGTVSGRLSRAKSLLAKRTGPEWRGAVGWIADTTVSPGCGVGLRAPHADRFCESGRKPVYGGASGVGGDGLCRGRQARGRGVEHDDRYENQDCRSHDVGRRPVRWWHAGGRYVRPERKPESNQRRPAMTKSRTTPSRFRVPGESSPPLTMVRNCSKAPSRIFG